MGVNLLKNEDVRLFRDSMRRLQRNLGWQSRNDAECCGVTIAQCHALLEIGKQEELSLVGLSELLNLDPSTLSRTIDHMVKSKLVERRISPEDRRYLNLSLTKTGQEVYDRINKTFDHYYKTIFAKIPADKHDQVLESIILFTTAVVETNCAKCCMEEQDNED
jgi:DNA-binding MarR family transcriptional regulator